MAKKKRKFTPSVRKRAKDLSQEEVNKLIDAGISVGRREPFNFNRVKDGKFKSSGMPSAKSVAEGLIGGHITREEASHLNRHYVQHLPKDFKEKKVKAPKPAKPKPMEPEYDIRVVNGREFKVYKVPQDTKIVEKSRKEERDSSRNIYRAKGTKY